MSVITISRGSFSGGKTIAERLAASLGFRCVDRDLIVEKAAAYGVSQKKLLEALTNPPTFLERFQHKKYLYLTLIQAALCEEVKQGQAVYHGNAGHLLLHGAGPVLRVRIIAPLEFRIAMARERLRLTESEATAYIRKMDDGRQRWTHYLYGVDWRDPVLYDLVINLDRITIDDAVAGVAAIVRRHGCFQFDDRCRAAMENLVVASRVKARLALNPETSHLEFEVTASAGEVFLSGKLPSVNLVDEVTAVALDVNGVEKVNLDGIVTPIQA